MKIALQIFSWIAVALGFLAVLVGEGDYYAFIGGALFMTQGILSLIYISKYQ